MIRWLTICCAMAAVGVPVAAADSTPAASVRLAAGGQGIDVVREGTEVRVKARQYGTVPRDQQPAKLEILGGYEVRGQTQARVLKRCDDNRCEVDPAIRTAMTWAYQAFLIGSGGMELAKSRLVKVQWVRQPVPATGP